MASTGPPPRWPPAFSTPPSAQPPGNSLLSVLIQYPGARGNLSLARARVGQSGCHMLRACSMFGLGGIFLMISPKLRASVQEAIGGVYTEIQYYAPFSYV